MDELNILLEKIEELTGREETIRNERQDLEAKARPLVHRASFISLFGKDPFVRNSEESAEETT